MSASRSSPTPEERIRELVGDLRPVRRIPPLRAALMLVVLPWLLAIGCEMGLRGLRARPSSDPVWSEPGFVLILVGLALGALGSTGASLASAVPGRDRAHRIGLVLAGIGFAIALGFGLGALVDAPIVMDAQTWAGCVSCLTHAAGLGAASCLVAGVLVARSALRRPLVAASLAAFGGGALGAVAVHSHCAAGEPLHQLVAHVLAPVVCAGIATLPLGLALSFRAARTR